MLVEFRAPMRLPQGRPPPLEKRGTPIGPLDTLTGAHAAALDVILVTHNTREFGRIDTLRVEDWTSS